MLRETSDLTGSALSGTLLGYNYPECCAKSFSHIRRCCMGLNLRPSGCKVYVLLLSYNCSYGVLCSDFLHGL